MGTQPALTTSMSIRVSWPGKWMKMLSGEWLGPCQASSARSPPHLEGVAVGEGDLRRRPGRVIIAQQQPPGVLVPDADHVPVEQRGRAGVAGVVMGVDEVGHRA